jgi:hypothetical protein
MAGKKTFVAGEVLTAQDVNDYLMDQTVMTFASSAARSSAIPTPTQGMISYQTDTDAIEAYDGSNWVTRVSKSVPFAMAGGTAAPVWTSSATALLTVTYPASRFTQAPLVFINDFSPAGATIGSTYKALSNTTSSFQIRGAATSVVTATGGVYWQAVQMTSASASG